MLRYMSRTDSEEARDLSRKLFGVGERMKAEFEAVAAAHGLTGLQARTLLSLERPCRMSALADVMSCDASNVTGLADRLDRLGLIERVPDEHDRRIKRLRLTAQGESRRVALAAAVASASTVTATLTPSERGALESLLDKMLDG